METEWSLDAVDTQPSFTGGRTATGCLKAGHHFCFWDLLLMINVGRPLLLTMSPGTPRQQHRLNKTSQSSTWEIKHSSVEPAHNTPSAPARQTNKEMNYHELKSLADKMKSEEAYFSSSSRASVSQVGAFNIYTCAAGTECSPRARKADKHPRFHPYPQGPF